MDNKLQLPMYLQVKERFEAAKKISPTNWQNLFRIENLLIRNILSEFFATGFLRFIGTGASICYVIGLYNYFQMNFVWGMGVVKAIFLAWNTSGSLLNPALSILSWLCGRVELVHAFWYCCAQFFGAFVGTAL